jgi:hypothetical protein
MCLKPCMRLCHPYAASRQQADWTVSAAAHLGVVALEVLLGGAVGHVRAVPQARDADIPELRRGRVAVQPLPGVQDLRVVQVSHVMGGRTPIYRRLSPRAMPGVTPIYGRLPPRATLVSHPWASSYIGLQHRVDVSCVDHSAQHVCSSVAQSACSAALSRRRLLDGDFRTALGDARTIFEGGSWSSGFFGFSALAGASAGGAAAAAAAAGLTSS